MKFHGRDIDPVSFWQSYVEFPAGMDQDDMFSPLVMCPNPSHDNSRTPAFQVNLRQPLVHCFSYCGIQGGYEHAVCVVEGLYDHFKVDEATNEQERLRRKRRAKREAKKLILKGARASTRMAPVKAETKRKKLNLSYERFLPPIGMEYLTERGIDQDAISLWEIGWDSDEKRIVFPVHDEYHRVKFLIRRAVMEKQHPKYLYSEDSMKTELLFGADKIPNGAAVTLVEGSIDVIKLTQHGIPAVGILGTGISQKQIEILARRRPKMLYLMFDRDAAGIRNIEIAVEKLKKYPLFVCRYPKGKEDPAELTRQEALRSIERSINARLWLRDLKAPQKRA